MALRINWRKTSKRTNINGISISVDGLKWLFAVRNVSILTVVEVFGEIKSLCLCSESWLSQRNAYESLCWHFWTFQQIHVFTSVAMANRRGHLIFQNKTQSVILKLSSSIYFYKVHAKYHQRRHHSELWWHVHAYIHTGTFPIPPSKYGLCIHLWYE